MSSPCRWQCAAGALTVYERAALQWICTEPNPDSSSYSLAAGRATACARGGARFARGPMDPCAHTTYGCGRVLARARADAHTGRGERREACTHRDPGRIPETAASGVSCAAEPTSADPVHTAATCHRANMRARRDQYLCV